MLTKNEKEWLENRTRYHDSPPDYYFCGWCTIQGCLRQRFYLCPLSWNNDDFREAAEFEARVAAKLVNLAYKFAEWSGDDSIFGCDEICPIALFNNGACDTDLSCKEAMLKYARLEVEEEMDNAASM